MAGKASLIHFGSTSIVATEVVAVQLAPENQTLVVFRGGGRVFIHMGYREVLERLGWKEPPDKARGANDE